MVLQRVRAQSERIFRRRRVRLEENCSFSVESLKLFEVRLYKTADSVQSIVSKAIPALNDVKLASKDLNSFSEFESSLVVLRGAKIQLFVKHLFVKDINVSEAPLKLSFMICLLFLTAKSVISESISVLALDPPHEGFLVLRI